MRAVCVSSRSSAVLPVAVSKGSRVPQPPLTPQSFEVLILADPQIIGRDTYSSLPAAVAATARFFSDAYLRKVWLALTARGSGATFFGTSSQPDLVIFNGDLTDRGRWKTSEESWVRLHRRWTSIFDRTRIMQRTPSRPLRKRANKQLYPVVVLPGNHDIGLPKQRGGPRDEHSLAWQRFQQHFALSVDEDYVVAEQPAPAQSVAPSWNARLRVAALNDSVSYELMFVNAQDLVGIQPLGSPSFAALSEVASAGQKLAPDTTRFITKAGHAVRDDVSGTCSRILFSHVPLARDEDERGCDNLERSSHHRVYRERQHGRTPGAGIEQGGGLNTTYQNLLLPDVSRWVLSELQSSLVFSGDDHDHCETVHKSSRDSALSRGGVAGFKQSDVPELTVKSMSMLEGVRRPGFARLQLHGGADAEHAGGIAYRPCLLPDQIGLWLYVYAPCFFATVLFLCWRMMKMPSRSPLPTHVDDDTRESYPLEPSRTTLTRLAAKTRHRPLHFSGSRLLSDIVLVAAVPLPLWFFLQFT